MLAILLKSNIAILMLVNTLAGCGNSENFPATGKVNKLDIQISEKIVLPEGSDPLRRYSRYYAYDRDGAILGVLVQHNTEFPEQVREACERQDNGAYPCDQVDFGIADPGEAKWLSDRNDLPAQSGGACSYIRLRYDPSIEEILELKCNGNY